MLVVDMIVDHCDDNALFNDVRITVVVGRFHTPQWGMNKCRINIIMFPCAEYSVCARNLGSSSW